MRTNDIILEQLVSMLTNIDFKKISKGSHKKQKEDLLNYLNKEYLNIDDYKHLLSNIKLSKEDILELLYLVFIVTTENEKISFKDSFSKTKKLIKIAAELGFTWPNSTSCFDKVEEEFAELKNAINSKNTKNIKEEMGDLLFTLQCYAEIKNFNLNDILSTSNYKFEKRFSKLKEIAEIKNIKLNKASSKTKEKLWKIAKKKV
ncbi:MAG: hypothetical protein CMJ08_06390 [Pelagibacterales bacterium]|nr:hypothetical protein [Pelagibacterales bacterium]